MPLSADELTRIAVNEFFKEKLGADAVQCQLQSIDEIDCNVTSVGIVSRFQVNSSAPKVLGGATRRLGGLEGRLLPLDVKCGFELWIENGHIASLEGFSYSDDWPHVVDACQFSRTDHVS
jgi:hypothetical protein